MGGQFAQGWQGNHHANTREGVEGKISEGIRIKVIMILVDDIETEIVNKNSEVD